MAVSVMTLDSVMYALTGDQLLCLQFKRVLPFVFRRGENPELKPHRRLKGQSTDCTTNYDFIAKLVTKTMSVEFEMYYKNGSVWELHPRENNATVHSSTSLQRLAQRCKSEIWRLLTISSNENYAPRWTSSGPVRSVLSLTQCKGLIVGQVLGSL
jgi:hypothetical protein